MGRKSFFRILGVFILSATDAFASNELILRGLAKSIPFAGLLLSIALFPLIREGWWHRNMGKVSFVWAAITVGLMIGGDGLEHTIHQVAHTFFLHYLPFIILVGTLFILGSGVRIVLKGRASPWSNAAFLAMGSLLASLIGTTGASMLLIRPFISLNRFRRYKTHTVIFFIFLIANIGGCLTPLGDPPLFLGFLEGISFFWPLQNMLIPFCFMVGSLLAVFILLDFYYFYHDPHVPHPEDFHAQTSRFQIKGKRNFLLLLGVIGMVLTNGIWTSSYHLFILGTDINLSNIVRDGGLMVLALLSLSITPPSIYQENNFTWEPLFEVIQLFAGIFVTIIPVLSLLHAGTSGAFGTLFKMMNPGGTPMSNLYFWVSGMFSSFLDNAPTYLVFFHMAGGEPRHLMGELSPILLAISCGSVFMGALTYIGNAPNFMVKAIAVRAHVKMPNFLGYIVWSGGILLPLFFILSFLLFNL